MRAKLFVCAVKFLMAASAEASLPWRRFFLRLLPVPAGHVPADCVQQSSTILHELGIASRGRGDVRFQLSGPADNEVDVDDKCGPSAFRRRRRFRLGTDDYDASEAPRRRRRRQEFTEISRAASPRN